MTIVPLFSILVEEHMFYIHFTEARPSGRLLNNRMWCAEPKPHLSWSSEQFHVVYDEPLQEKGGTFPV